MKEWLYVYGEGKNKNFKQALLSPAGIFCVLFAVFMIVWFLCDTVAAGRTVGFGNALRSNLFGLFALLTCCFILLISALGAGRKKKTPNGNVIRIGAEDIVIIRAGKKINLFRSELTCVALEKRKDGYRLRFSLADGREEEFPDLLPLFDLPRLYRLFGSFLTVNVPPKEKTGEKKTDGVRIAMICFLSLPILAGIAVIALFACGWNIPFILGVFFLLSGGVLLCSVSHNALIKNCFLPLFAGSAFTVAPSGFALEIAQRKGIAASLAELFAGFPFTPLHCGVVFLTAVGLIGIIQAIVNFIRYFIAFLSERKLRAC